MLNFAMGDKGSFCDNCAAPTSTGFELRSPITSIFFCECCAERKFGTREIERAKEKMKAILKGDSTGRLAALISGAPINMDKELRPIGFLR